MASQPGTDAVSNAETKPAAAEDKRLEELGDVPDPDEDDLDDLDDMLDDFSALNTDSQKKPVIPSASLPETAAALAKESSTSAATTTNDEELGDDDFEKQLQASMAELMGDMNSPELQAQFESFFKELGAAAAGEASSSSAAGPAGSKTPTGSASAAGVGPDAFQETIRRTMERMQASGDSATAAAAADTSSSDDFMAELLKQMAAGGLDAEGGGGSEEELSKMLLGMMEQLTNKDILYEPMKELDDKFPEWMSANREKVSEEDRKRYELQQGYVREIVAKFEEPTYSDSNPADREFIVERMQKMQDAGSPPADLVGNMPSAQDALGIPDLDELFSK